jgi:thymidylate synthase (FAD)
MLKLIEEVGRLCYKSEDKIEEDSCKNFVKGLIKRGHDAMLEHEKITVVVTCDRGVSHEIVRHRIASYAQESTRYCNYSNDKFGNEITFIKPLFYPENTNQYYYWSSACEESEKTYLKLLEHGSPPQEARSVLPNSLKTEIAITMNLREWRHFFKLRAVGVTGKPHPQMLEITIPMLVKFKEIIPVIFDDLEVK